MTEQEARAWNAGIEAAVAAYSGGIGAIKELKIKHVVVVEHIGTTTKQEVVDLEKDG